MKKPSKTLEELTQEQGVKPFGLQEWRRKYGRHFDDFDVDSFLEGIYESKHRKLPDYMRTKK